MQDGNNIDAPRSNAIHDAVIFDDQFAKANVCNLLNHSSYLRMMMENVYRVIQSVDDRLCVSGRPTLVESPESFEVIDR